MQVANSLTQYMNASHTHMRKIRMGFGKEETWTEKDSKLEPTKRRENTTDPISLLTKRAASLGTQTS